MGLRKSELPDPMVDSREGGGYLVGYILLMFSLYRILFSKISWGGTPLNPSTHVHVPVYHFFLIILTEYSIIIFNSTEKHQTRNIIENALSEIVAVEVNSSEFIWSALYMINKVYNTT